MHPPAPRASIAVRTTPISLRVVETIFIGRVTAPLVTRAFDDLEAYPGAKVWIVDLLGADGYDAGAIPTATERVKRAREAGLEKLITVIQSAALRMAASVVGMATGFKIVIASTREEASRLAE